MQSLLQRKELRLRHYNYSSPGGYFITICVKQKQKLLGTVDVGAIINRPQIELSEYGKIANESINEISTYYPQILVDKYVVMPNHIHMILFVKNNTNNGRLIIAPTNVSIVIQQFKRFVSKQIGFSIWQKSFYDHIIRSESEYREIWQYIDENPAKWQEDCYYI